MKRRQLLWLMLAAAASAEVVRLGYFGEAQPFQVACARGWFDVGDAQVVCLPQSSGGFAVAKLDDGDLDVALLGSTPAATGLARGVAMNTFYVAHMKGTSQGLLVRPEIGSPLDMKDKTFGTPYGSTAHYHMLYIRTLFPDVPFTLVNCNADCPDLYDAGTIDGAFVWGGVMEKMKARGTTMLAPAKLLSDWEKATFNTISVRAEFAADHSAVVERIAGVVARLDEDYLNADPTRWSVDDSTGYLDSIAAAYKLLPGDSAQSLKKNRTAAADALALFEFVDPTDEDEGMRSCNFLGAAQTGCTGTAAALRATADFLHDIGYIASKAPPAGIADIDAFYVGTTTAQFLEDGLASVAADVLETTGAGVASIPTDADSDCSGTVDLTATTGTLTDGAATSYSNDLACEWRIASSGVVELSFDAFRVWAGDYVKVYDASNDLVAKLHGFDRAWPPLRTNGEMRVEFTTDGVTERALNELTDGWSASYDAAALACAADHSTCGNGKCDTVSGLCICDAGYGGGDCSLATCLGTMTSSSQSGVFRSSPTAPDSTAPYPNGAECHFVAEVETNYVSFTITYDVEPTFDFVEVKSGDETWASLSGADTATIVVPTTDGKAELVFTSDPQGRRGGFSATYAGTDNGCGEDGLCGEHGQCKDGACECDPGYGGLSCTVPHCLDKALAVTDKTSMTMVSQAEGDVPAAASCAWEFQAAAGETIRVVVDTLNLEPYDGLKGDRVLIRNAGNITDVQIQAEATYEVSSSGVSLTLETDKNDAGATYDGFSATAYSVAACPNLRGGDCEDEGFTCEDGHCYDLSGGSKRASGCTCAGCDAGSYLDDATGGCEACPAGTYQPQAKNTVGASSCIACSAGMDAPEPGSALCCSEDYVLVGQKCAKCGTDDGDYKLTGTKCDTPETRTVATLEIEKGFFRFSPEATVVYPCPEKDDACGGWDPSKLVDSEDEFYGDRFCRDNAEGPLCLHCKKGSFRSKGDKSECKSCDSHGQLALQLVATVVLIAAWFAVLFGVKALRTRFHRDWFEAVAIQFVFFFVTMSRFVGIHQITLPDPLFKYMWALDFISLDLTSIQSVLRCGSKVTYFDFLLFWTLLAPALVVVVVVFAILRGLVTVYVRGAPAEAAGAPPDPAFATDSRRGEARFVSDRELEDEEQLPQVQRLALSVQRDLDAGLMVVFAVLTMFHSGICSTIFNTFNCSLTYRIDDDNSKRGLRYLAADYTISCSTKYVKRPRAPVEYDAYYDADSAAEHAFYDTYATVALVVYAIGVPLAYLAWMLRARRLARDEQRPVDDGALAFLTRSVKPEFWWFEVAALVARSLVTGMFLFVSPGVSLIMSFFVIVVHRTLVLQFRPYASTGLQLVVEALMRATFSIALVAVAVYGSDPILDSTTASVVAVLVFALNLSVLPFAYRAWRTESYRSVARRLRRREPVDIDEVEALLGGAHKQDIAEVVRKCGRHALRQAFDGHLDDKDWDYFTHTLLKLEGVWTEDVAAADVLQWHVKSILYRAKAYVRSHLQLKLNAREVDASVDVVAGPLSKSLVGDASPVAAYQKLGRPAGAKALEQVYALALRPYFFLEHEEGAVVGGLVRTMSVLGLMQGGHTNSSLLASMSRSQLSARSLLRNSGSHSSPVAAESKDESPSKVAERFKHAAKKISAVSRVAAKERPRHLPRFLDLAMVAHDLNQRAQARIATAARDIMEEEAGGATLAKLASFDLGEHHQPALRSKSLHAFKEEVGGAALEVELDAAVCVETLHALATAAFPAFRAALEKLFPPGTEGVELECDADFAVKSPARMRAKVDEYRRENETVWPRAKRLSDCLRASVVTADAARTVSAYEALSDSGAFTIVRLKNKLAEHAKPYCMHVNLKFQAPGLAAMTVEVQIVPKAIYSDQKTSHRLYTVARANSYAAYRGLAEEDSDDDDDDDADVAGDEEDLGVLTPTDARSPAEVPVWKFWARE